jgi:HemY protein
MFTILWFIFIALIITTSMAWVLDHDGSVIINWLGYEVQTDILTAVLLSIFFALMVFSFAYLLARILAFRFPNLFKIFFRKKYFRSLEKILHRHHQGFDLMVKMLLALEVHDEKSAENLRKKFSQLIKNSALNDFFLGKILFEKREFKKSYELFSKFTDNRHAKILVLKSKFELALEHKDEDTAIAYAKQILTINNDDFITAKALFMLYKKVGLWQEAKSLILKYGSEKFQDELQKRDVAVINSALAIEAYQQKKFLTAIKHAKIALKSENNFLPATEILLKSWIKMGFAFKAKWIIKNLWRENPHLIFAEIFDLIHRKSSPKNRIKIMKKLAAQNDESPLSKLAIGMVAFRVGEKIEAKEILRSSLLQQKTYRAYKLLAFTEKALGNAEDSKKYFSKAEMLSKDDHYFCKSCGHLSSKWSAKCSSCDSYDSLEWN